jgi:cation transport regulator ChaC
MLHFAYGSNMSRQVMRRRALDAVPLGVARLHGYRFLITECGYASVAPERTGNVYGVLWRISPRDRVMLDKWESVAAGLYGSEMLLVSAAGRRYRAVAYLARARHPGNAKPGYIEVVIAAAREWELPPAYVAMLLGFMRPARAGADNRGAFRWT